MTRMKLAPTDSALVAIDVSKNRNDVLIEVPGRTRRRRLVVPNTRGEHDHFIATLNGLGYPVIAHTAWPAGSSLRDRRSGS